MPVPETVWGRGWTDTGTLQSQIGFPGDPSELSIHRSRNPDGFCLALARFTQGVVGGHLDVICLGLETSNACFWHNNDDPRTAGEDPINLQLIMRLDLLDGGAALDGDGCTSCHAGENPFIVHPEDPAFKEAARLNNLFFGRGHNFDADDWYTALGPPANLDNADPSDFLDTVASDGKCTSCHQQHGPPDASGGRFPKISRTGFPPRSPYKAYCDTVLAGTLGADPNQSNFPPSMPLWDPEDPQHVRRFEAHIREWRTVCGRDEREGNAEPITVSDDTTFSSPPIVGSPIYMCVGAASVSGAVPDAEVILYVNGNEVDSVVPAKGGAATFSGLQLQYGDRITARQRVDGFLSGPSAAVTVSRYTDDYPQGLPRPVIDPSLVYECASRIGVRTVPGAQLTVYVNGANLQQNVPQTHWVDYYGGLDYALAFPGKYPFEENDVFKAEQSMCGSQPSPLSASVTAVRVSRAERN